MARSKFFVAAAWIGVGLAVLAVVVPLLWVGGFLALIVREGNRIEARQRTLVYEADHAELERAMAELLEIDRRRASDPAWPGWGFQPRQGDIPQAISDLEPNNIWGTGDEIIVELGGGFIHYGLQYYEDPTEGHGTKQLTDRLWFYEEEDRVPDP